MFRESPLLLARQPPGFSQKPDKTKVLLFALAGASTPGACTTGGGFRYFALSLAFLLVFMLFFGLLKISGLQPF